MELTSVFQLFDKCCLSVVAHWGTLVGVKNFFMSDIHLASAVLCFKTEILVTILGCSTTPYSLKSKFNPECTKNKSWKIN